MKILNTEIERLLGVAELSNISTLRTWLRVLSGMLTKELKAKEPNNDNLSKFDKLINTLVEYLIIQIDELEEESLVLYAPTLFETLIKTRDSILAYNNYKSSLENSSSKEEELELSSFHKELFKKIDNLQ